MGILRKFTSKRFVEDKSGNFAIMFAAAVSTLALGVGMAVNYAQLVNARSNLLHALDSAITSTARDITTGLIAEKDAKASVLAFLSANGDSPFADPGTLDLTDLTLDKATNTLSAKATVAVTLAFPLFSTDPVQKLTVDSAALYSDKKIEVAMMLDVTGSMGGQKIKDLQDAAKNAVGAFLDGQDPANPRIRVSIVPYADSVNTGALSSYVHRETSFTADINAPKFSAAFPVSFGWWDKCATDRKGSLKYSDASPLSGMINRDFRLAFCPAAELQPLTANKKKLIDTIEDFTANGHTAGGIGVQWTRYMLSPDWAKVLPAASAPADYKAKKTAKVAILMTDGEFNTAFAGVGQWSDPRNQPGIARTSAEEHCKAMKKDGIEIFTIGFQLNAAAAKQVMKACASPDVSSIKHYYEVSSGQALNDAFMAIVRNIENLAIVK